MRRLTNSELRLLWILGGSIFVIANFYGVSYLLNREADLSSKLSELESNPKVASGLAAREKSLAGLQAVAGREAARVGKNESAAVGAFGGADQERNGQPASDPGTELRGVENCATLSLNVRAAEAYR